MVWAEVLLNEQELRDSISRCGGHRKAKTVLFVRFDCPVKQLSDFCTKLSVLWSSKGGLILATSMKCMCVKVICTCIHTLQNIKKS